MPVEATTRPENAHGNYDMRTCAAGTAFRLLSTDQLVIVSDLHVRQLARHMATYRLLSYVCGVRSFLAKPCHRMMVGRDSMMVFADHEQSW